MPVEQGLPWHPVATGLAGQAIPLIVAASHAHALPSAPFWFPVPAVPVASPPLPCPSSLYDVLALVPLGVAPAFGVSVLLLPMSVGAPGCLCRAPPPVPPACHPVRGFHISVRRGLSRARLADHAQHPTYWWSLPRPTRGWTHTSPQLRSVDSPELSPQMGSPSAAQKAKERQHTTFTPTNTTDRSVVDLKTCAKVPGAPCTTQLQVGQLDCHNGMQGATCCPPPPPRQHTPAAVSVPTEKERTRNWEERKQQSNWAQSHPTHGSETSPNRTPNNTEGNHEVRALHQPPNAAHAERAIIKHPLPRLPLQGAYVLHKGEGCTLRPGGACHGGGNRAMRCPRPLH